MAGNLLSQPVIPNRGDVHSPSIDRFRGCLGYDCIDGCLPNGWFGGSVHLTGIRRCQPGSCVDEFIDHFEFGDHSVSVCCNDGILNLINLNKKRGKQSIALVFPPLLAFIIIPKKGLTLIPTSRESASIPLALVKFAIVTGLLNSLSNSIKN